MFKELTERVYDKTFKTIILKNQINIINYEEILVFEDEKILIKTKEYLIKVLGENLSITRLYNQEVLIEGKIKTVEFG